MSINGETKVDKGESTCSSDDTSHAVAVNNSRAEATNSSTAVAVNDSLALGLIDCTVTAQNGEIDACAF